MLAQSIQLNSPKQIAIAITNAPLGTGYLAFRDLPNILNEYVSGLDVLDVGCGTGRSTRFLRDLGYNVTGIDICQEMISEARLKDTQSQYLLISDRVWPVDDKKYDLIALSFVTLEISSIEEMCELFNNAKKYLKDNGVILVVTTSESAYKHDWLSMGSDFVENQNPKSGDVVKIRLKDYGFEVKDYFWTDFDYRSVFDQSNLSVIWKYNPLGTKDDGKSWINEETISPFSIYITKTKNDKPGF